MRESVERWAWRNGELLRALLDKKRRLRALRAAASHDLSPQIVAQIKHLSITFSMKRARASSSSAAPAARARPASAPAAAPARAAAASLSAAPEPASPAAAPAPAAAAAAAGGPSGARQLWVVLEQASLETVKTKRGFELLNSDEHGGHHARAGRQSALSRPDITHQVRKILRGSAARRRPAASAARARPGWRARPARVFL